VPRVDGLEDEKEFKKSISKITNEPDFSTEKSTDRKVGDVGRMKRK
jgi:hypothetical protein